MKREEDSVEEEEGKEEGNEEDEEEAEEEGKEEEDEEEEEGRGKRGWVILARYGPRSCTTTRPAEVAAAGRS